jgi:hypothetical protein
MFGGVCRVVAERGYADEARAAVTERVLPGEDALMSTLEERARRQARRGGSSRLSLLP